MEFAERLKGFRRALGFSQQKVADLTGLTIRTIQNYESGKHPPKNMEQIKKLCGALDVPLPELLGEADFTVLDAKERGGDRAARDMRILVSRVSAMFAGGDLSESDRDAAMMAISDAYWMAKEENKKYVPKNRRNKGVL